MIINLVAKKNYFVTKFELNKQHEWKNDQK